MMYYMMVYSIYIYTYIYVEYILYIHIHIFSIQRSRPRKPFLPGSQRGSAAKRPSKTKLNGYYTTRDPIVADPIWEPWTSGLCRALVGASAVPAEIPSGLSGSRSKSGGQKGQINTSIPMAYRIFYRLSGIWFMVYSATLH